MLKIQTKNGITWVYTSIFSFSNGNNISVSNWHSRNLFPSISQRWMLITIWNEILSLEWLLFALNSHNSIYGCSYGFLGKIFEIYINSFSPPVFKLPLFIETKQTSNMWMRINSTENSNNSFHLLIAFLMRIYYNNNILYPLFGFRFGK